jgi:tetratricopeptide (TPR) repeat protein/tRNA A-37 threonylcarbamoyl transferase component Bud32
MGDALVTPSEPDGLTNEDEFLLWMASTDERTATGASVAPLPAAAAPEEVRARWERDAAWCEWVRTVWPVAETIALEPPILRLDDERAPRLESYYPELARFQILRVLGRGAFGEVYQAYDSHLRREVALKVPRPEIFLTPMLRARFRQEARAAAGLDHPHIVPVYDAGEDGSTCFIASAYCPGVTLAEWLRRRSRPVAHKLAAELMVKLADAVEHAHNHGVLHRDLKPSNVLLDGPAKDGLDDDASALTPRITDFGLAKLVDLEPDAQSQAAATMSGVILGTPSYMAPEQADGRGASAGPAADVYSLGAILYEVLTGRPPLQGDSTFETLVLVKTQDPIPPSRLRPHLPRDLETICLKCLHKQPHARYASAKEMADDLRRFLAARPIIARPTPAYERAAKWVRRNPARATAAGALIIAAVAFAVVISAANIGLKRERDRAEARRKEAVANLSKAREAVDRLLTRVSEERLRDIPHVEPIQRALLEDALEFYKDLARQSHGDPEILFEAGRAYRRVGKTYLWLGRDRESERHLNESLAIQTRLANAFPNVAVYRQEQAGAHLDLGKLARTQDQADKAISELDTAVASFRKLADADPTAAQYRAELAAAYNTRGMVNAEQNRPKESEEDYQRGLALLDELARQSPDALKFRANAAVIRNNVAATMLESRRFAEAESMYRKNLELWETFSAREPTVADHKSKLALTLDNLADVFVESGRPELAEQTLRRCVELRAKIVGDFPNTPYWKGRLANDQERLAAFAAARGELVDARRLYAEVVRHRRSLVAFDPNNRDDRVALARSYSLFIESLLKISDHVKAAETVDEWVAVAGLPPDDLKRAGSFLARCSSLATADASIATGRRAELTAVYASRAVKLLRNARDQGAWDRNELERDSSFDVLRSRDDFRALLSAPNAPPAPRGP